MNDSNSERIKVIQDDPNDDRLQAFCKLYDVIEKRPDADRQFDKAFTALRALAGEAEDTPARTKKPKKRVYWPRKLTC